MKENSVVNKYGTLNMQHAIWTPVKKNDVVRVNYTFNGTTSIFRFIYAQGSESEVN
jgi:hypothetical protein